MFKWRSVVYTEECCKYWGVFFVLRSVVNTKDYCECWGVLWIQRSDIVNIKECCEYWGVSAVLRIFLDVLSEYLNRFQSHACTSQVWYQFSDNYDISDKRAAVLYVCKIIPKLQLVPITCPSCRRNYCLRHRHPQDHNCTTAKSTNYL